MLLVPGGLLQRAILDFTLRRPRPIADASLTPLTTFSTHITPSQMIRLKALGQSVVEVRRSVIRPDAEMVFATLLILCVERGRGVERTTLTTMLWPRESVTNRGHNLRQILYKLRRLGIDVGATQGMLKLSAAAVWLDYEDADAEVTRDGGAELATLNGGRFLPKYAPRYSRQFSEWLETVRGRAEGRVRRRIVEAIGVARGAGRWEQVELLARNCLELDPLNEEATLALAECIALAGAKTKAVAMLDAYVSEMGHTATDARLPAAILRRRVADRLAPRRLRGPLETKLIGREDVMSSLTAAFQRAKSREPNSQLVWGPPGIGKTRVLEEMGKIAALMGGRVFSQGSAVDDHLTPGLSLVRLLGAMMEAPGVLGLSPDVLALLKQLTARAPGLESALPLDLGDDVLVRALVDLERAIAWEGTVVIVFDDLHQADELSRRVISRAHRCLSSEPILLLTASVPRPSDMVLPGASLHELGRLSADATARLATAVLEQAGTPCDESTVDALAAASGGHPFILRETIIAWLHDPGAASTPTLDATLHRRVEALSAHAREVLFTALILGEHATVPLLMDCEALPAVDVERALVELEEEQIVRVTADGRTRIHSLWLSSVESLVPMALAIARRHRVAQVLEKASHNSLGAAELLLASATQYQRSGDVSRAASVLAQSGAALKGRALAPGAYAAYSRAAEMAPASEEFERSVAQAIIAGWDARLAEEVGPLVARYAGKLRGSALLTPMEKAELDVIGIEVGHAHLGEETNGASCLAMLSSGAYTSRQRLRLAVSGAQAADHDYDTATVAAIAKLAADIPCIDPLARHAARQVAMVHAMSTRQISRARELAEQELLLIDQELAPRDRCRPLLSSRIPFWFDCDFARVELVIASARSALQSYSCTVDALRTEDIYATHCIETMRLTEASNVIDVGERLAQDFNYTGLQRNFAELRQRLAIASRDQSIVDNLTTSAPGLGRSNLRGRHRTFALCNAAVGLARNGGGALLKEVVDELTEHWGQISVSCPFDYACVALAIGVAVIRNRSDAREILANYFLTTRIARNSPSPFVCAIAAEFDLRV